VSAGQSLAYINGEYFSEDEAKMSVFDMGFMKGVNVFDAMPMWQGFILKMYAHIDRFYRSMHATRIKLQLSKDELREVILETARRSELKDAMLVPIATWGPFPVTIVDGKIGGSDYKPTLIVLCIPYFYILDPLKTETGGKLKISSARQIPVQCIDQKIKNFNRLYSTLALWEAFDFGADDVIMLTIDGYVSESRSANIWIVKDGKLFTSGEEILQGITRGVVFEIAKLENIEAAEARLTPYDIYNADELFLCSSAGGIMPFVEVDSRTIGDGRPGPITKRLSDTYWKMHVDPKHAVQVYEAKVTA